MPYCTDDLGMGIIRPCVFNVADVDLVEFFVKIWNAFSKSALDLFPIKYSTPCFIFTTSNSHIDTTYNSREFLHEMSRRQS